MPLEFGSFRERVKLVEEAPIHHAHDKPRLQEDKEQTP